MKKYILIFMVFLLLIFGQVFFIGNQVGLGELIFNTEKIIDQKKLENSELEKEIAVNSSYINISEKANLEVTNGKVALKR